MSASDHLQPKQLAMFMPARTIVATHDLGDAHGNSLETKVSTIREKGAANQKVGRDFSGGIREPITVHHRDGTSRGTISVVLDGHHRLAGAYDSNAEVPIEHSDMRNTASINPKSF